MHFPDPLAPMESAMLERSLGDGFGYGARVYDAPIERVVIRTIGGYPYQAMVMVTGTPEEMAARGARAEQVIRAASAASTRSGPSGSSPRSASHLGFWDSFDLAGATRAALRRAPRRDLDAPARVWELHFEMVLPAYLAISEFDELYRGLFPDAGPLDSYRLLEGLPNMTVEVGQAMWRLSRRAVASPVVRAVLADHADADVPVALYATHARAARSSPSSRPTSTATAAAPTRGRSWRRAGPRTRRRSSSACATSCAARRSTSPPS